ncbi:uncharacterized protein LOC126372618 [Pectinophora gossypiella]|uniref:Uncharacterized protein n=1 Tax=Pectinophora gossypiella TaxID=13191 RepID=A0A1E1WC92_PECGO|nr:uncharacterized protein LOC126372618 [Pectinophora gossypiella]
MKNCLHKPRKPMVPLKTLDIIFRRRHLKNTQFYFTNRKHAFTEDKPGQKKITPFRIPRSQNLLSYIKYSDRKEKALSRQRIKQPLHLKDNLKIAATRDISKRLFIQPVPDDVRAVVEIHPEFYTVIEGRPLRFHDDIKSYLFNIRNFAMYRQQIGYRRDLILKIDQTMIEESNLYDEILENLKQHIKNFQKYLTEDYKDACAKVSMAEKIYEDLLEKSSEILSYITQITIINNIIFKLDSIRNVLKGYRTYLLFAAPLYWRQEFDESYKRFDSSMLLIRSEEFITENDLVDTLDIDKIVETARIELTKPYLPHMYFKQPNEMLYLFRTMELQSREYLIQLSKSDIPHRMLQSRIKRLKLSTKQELDLSQYYIDSVSKEIERELYNEIYLQEKFLRILNGTFYDTIASPDVLKLKICVEYVYERILGKSDEGHECLRDPMRILEVMYEEYNLKLDGLDFKIVNEARSDFFAQDLKMMRDAYHAQRVLREFREMTNAMNKAFLPPAHFTRPVIGKFLNKKAKSVAAAAEKRKARFASGDRVRHKKYKVTEEQREDLYLFTEWCDAMNPAPFLKDIETYIKPTFAMVTKSTASRLIFE